MPLVFIILVMAFIGVTINELGKKGNKQQKDAAYKLRKTNARLERSLVDYYMKHGFSLAEAVKETYEDLLESGFEPCIPLDAYAKSENGWWESSELAYSYVESYDSDAVNEVRDLMVVHWRKLHPDEPMPYSNSEFNKLVYSNIPKRMVDFMIVQDAYKLWNSVLPVHTIVIHDTYGICEITNISHGDRFPYGWASATYELMSLKTKHTYVSYVKHNEIRKL